MRFVEDDVLARQSLEGKFDKCSFCNKKISKFKNKWIIRLIEFLTGAKLCRRCSDEILKENLWVGTQVI